MFKTVNVVNLYAYHPTKRLYPEYNLRASSFEERGTDVGDRGNGKADAAVDTTVGTY